MLSCLTDQQLMSEWSVFDHVIDLHGNNNCITPYEEQGTVNVNIANDILQQTI